MAKKKIKKKEVIKKKITKKPETKWVEKDAHVQYVAARPKTAINVRERRPQ